MSNLYYSGLLSAASLEKIEGQLVACPLEELDHSGQVDRIDSAVTESNPWDIDSQSEEFFGDTETDGSPDDYFSLPKARRTPKPLGGPWTDQTIFVLTPCSSAPSSPTFSASSASSNEHEEVQQQSPPNSSPAIPTTQGLVSSLHALTSTHASISLIHELESALLSHLHSTPATLSDVQALIPTLSSRHHITAELATNIGLYHSRGLISDSVVEAMLIHMLTSDAEWLMARIRAQIDRFACEKAGQPSAKQHRHQSNLAIQAAKKEEQDETRRRRSMPKAWRQHSIYVPYGCTSVADLYAQDGLGWRAVQRIEKYARIAREKREKGTVAVEDGVGKQSFARTRLHNGPGLGDVRKPKVRLPVAQRGEVEVGMEGGLGISVGVGVRSKVGCEGLFGEEVSVRMPPC